jgi:hypothetical protein
LQVSRVDLDIIGSLTYLNFDFDSASKRGFIEIGFEVYSIVRRNDERG